MEARHFIYSQTQRDIALEFEPHKEVNQVFCNGTWVPYTEINSTGNSNFEDAQHLGIYPRWWIKSNGAVQDADLLSFITRGK